MGWADNYIAKLAAGETVSFRPRGNSMTGRVDNGDLVTVVPASQVENFEAGDVVLCRVKGSQYLHLIKAVQGESFLIGNNRGGTNGWVRRQAIFGKCVKVEK